MNKKVLWIVNQYAGSQIHGMELRHYYLAKEMIKQGHTVCIISGSYSHLFSVQPKITQRFTPEIIEGIQYVWVECPSYKSSVSIGRIWNMLVFAWRLYFFETNTLPKPDAVLVSSPSLFPIHPVKRWTDRFHAKLFFEVRDIWPLTLQYLGGLKSWHPLIIFMQAFENFAYKNSDRVISLLPSAFIHMESKGMLSKKFFYLPNGIFLEQALRKVSISDSTKMKLPNGFIVGYTGSIGVANAMDYLLEAASILRKETNIYFVIVGNGSEKDRLQTLAKDLPNVTFMDPVPKDQLQDLLQFFSVCYLGWNDEPLYRFGISANKIFDYMYSGKPILHSSNTAMDPIIASGSGISVKAQSSTEIAEAILKFYSMSPESRNEMGEKGKSYVVSHHNYELLASNLIHLIK